MYSITVSCKHGHMYTLFVVCIAYRFYILILCLSCAFFNFFSITHGLGYVHSQAVFVSDFFPAWTLPPPMSLDILLLLYAVECMT